MSHKETSRTSISSARLPYSSFQLDDEATATTTTMANEPFSCASCCCFKGCQWCVIGLVYFFILLPTGLLLMIHGYNTATALTLGLGVLVVLVSTCGLPGAIFGCRWWRRRRRKQRRQAAFSSNGSTKLVDSSFDVIATESIAPPVV